MWHIKHRSYKNSTFHLNIILTSMEYQSNNIDDTKMNTMPYHHWQKLFNLTAWHMDKNWIIDTKLGTHGQTDRPGLEHTDSHRYRQKMEHKVRHTDQNWNTQSDPYTKIGTHRPIDQDWNTQTVSHKYKQWNTQSDPLTKTGSHNHTHSQKHGWGTQSLSPKQPDCTRSWQDFCQNKNFKTKIGISM